MESASGLKSPGKPLLYIILGAAGSGRREVIADLVTGGLGEEDCAVLLSSAGEGAAGEALAGVAATGCWRLEAGTIDAQVPPGATHVFFLTDGRSNPVDQLEALVPWSRAAGLEVARVITVVNCQFAERHAELLAWFDACIHFSDVTLLHRREGVANKWLSDFQARYRDQYYPCLFELVKGGRVRNPALVLEAEARRMSHVFDADVWAGFSLEGVEFGTEDGEEGGDGDGKVGDGFASSGKAGKRARRAAKKKEAAGNVDDDGIMDLPEIDPYFERRAGGQRIKMIPDVSRFL
ncbi:MAG: hypothetical protein LBK99_19355 [Opitutaceae bacterium]|jgi:hypothetical protein|nr:hypothetical protein [Opitutaceae bacterium]